MSAVLHFHLFRQLLATPTRLLSIIVKYNLAAYAGHL